MATFTLCVRNLRKDNFYPVYIRVAHKGQNQYIKTDYLINQKSLIVMYDSQGKRKETIADKFVLKQCLIQIDAYVVKLNKISTQNMNCKEIISFLQSTEEEILFSTFAKKFIKKMIDDGRIVSSNNYKSAVQSLRKGLDKSENEPIHFTDITSIAINRWIEQL